MTISNSDKVIDSRDVIARIEELESERQSAAIHTTCIHCGLDIEGSEDSDDWRDRGNNSHCPTKDPEDPATVLCEHEAPSDVRGELDEEDAEELKTLQALHDEASGYAADWYHGAQLIRDSYFEEYAQQLAEDIGAIGRDLQWPACYIDWAAAADALKIDYTSVDFDGVEYWVR